MSSRHSALQWCFISWASTLLDTAHKRHKTSRKKQQKKKISPKWTGPFWLICCLNRKQSIIIFQYSSWDRKSNPRINRKSPDENTFLGRGRLKRNSRQFLKEAEPLSSTHSPISLWISAKVAWSCSRLVQLTGPEEKEMAPYMVQEIRLFI